MQDTFRQIAPIHVDYLASYFDFFSFGVTILLAVALAFGLKESSMANNVVTCLNVAVVLFIIVAGSLQADPANWSIAANSTNATVMGAGGFFPWGVEGMIKGAATCFYGFVGFDCIATTGEEVRNPRRAIPVSIIVSLLVIFLAYFGVSTVLTLMVPYYLQDINAPIPIAFEAVGWTWAKWIVVVGALFGLCASLFGAMFPLPRIIYAMGSDGLVFRVLAKVHPRFQTPVVGSIVAGLITGLMSALFDLNQLINMMSIGTLQAYTIVAASVLLLRYNGDSNSENFQAVGNQDGGINGGSSFTRSLKYLINCSVRSPSQLTQNIVAVEVPLKRGRGRVCHLLAIVYRQRRALGHRPHFHPRGPDCNCAAVHGHPAAVSPPAVFQGAAGAVRPCNQHPGQRLPDADVGLPHVGALCRVDGSGFFCLRLLRTAQQFARLLFRL
ncbi:hypothetical protein D910_04209 [Dendroctonus ponderosae]|uniref:Cationic amino acid transporter C-terminal domain-containing protein n=1 Tax=Dendroctonus ponderosae TaxID=77166 RepID=U4UA30_DENPD|nr:hypothetical protein D910_04209 [Dendroctonus ponderosae]